MEYLVVNWKWEVLIIKHTIKECEDWMEENPTPGNSYAIVVRTKEIMSAFTEEEMQTIHTAFWFGVDAERQKENLVDAYWKMVDQLEEEKKNG